MKNIETIGRRLARIRKNRGLTQKELAKLIGDSSDRMICHYEKTSNIPLDKLKKIAIGLKTSTDEILGIKTMEIKELNDKTTTTTMKLLKQVSTKSKKAILNYVEALYHQEHPQ